MKYHSLKMGEVNDTMKHLWNKTYQGTGMRRFVYYSLRRTLSEYGLSDIDGIKITSDPDTGTGTRRTYNYRVRTERRRRCDCRVDAWLL